MNTNNPLQQFFRKPKFTIQLPSRGKWYPKNALKNPTGLVEIYAMTAVDETRSKTSEIMFNGNSLFDLLKSCVPEIQNPEFMPTVDLESVMLSIRRASYGDTIDIEVAVPNTNLTTTAKFNIEKLINSIPNAETAWDEVLNILSEEKETISLTIKPLNLRNLFSITKQIIKQQQAADEINRTSQLNDQKIDQLDEQMKQLANLSVNMVADSISKITVGTFTTENPSEIRQFVNNIDVEYFKAIQNHIENQKNNLLVKPQIVVATEEQIQQGAPAQWEVPVQFDLTNFLR